MQYAMHEDRLWASPTCVFHPASCPRSHQGSEEPLQALWRIICFVYVLSDFCYVRELNVVLTFTCSTLLIDERNHAWEGRAIAAVSTGASHRARP